MQMQNPPPAANVWADWFTQSVRTIGDAHLNDYVSTQFPARVVETVPNAAPNVVDSDVKKKQAQSQQDTQRMLLIGSGVVLAAALAIKALK